MAALISPDNLLSLADYASWRRLHHRRMLAHKRLRCVPLGPWMRVSFEDELTLRYQIQEALRMDRADSPEQRRREIELYAPLLPSGADWRATLQIELPNASERRRELPLLSSATHDVYIEVARQQRVYAIANADLPDRHLSRPSAVHFLRFDLPERARAAITAGAPVSLGCAHDRYAWRRVIGAATLASLSVDLQPHRARVELPGLRPIEPPPRRPPACEAGP